MNRQITFSKAVEGYLLAAAARHLSQFTLDDYKKSFRRFLDFLGYDSPIAEITTHQVEAFLASLALSKKTVLNYHIALSALWTWAISEEITQIHIPRRVIRPKPEKRAIKPYSEADVRAMLGAISHSSFYTRPGKRESRHSLLHTERNRAMILLLIDTGMRASELCELKIFHTDLRNRKITVFGKGSKERMVPISARTAQAIWKYLATRISETAGNTLFSTGDGSPMDRDQLLKVITRLARRAGVLGANTHRFRHTFAINFLRNGGDAYSLQMILGHSTLDMVKTYLAIAQTDLDQSHKLASPVDHWRL